MRKFIVLMMAMLLILSGCTSPSSVPDLSLDDPRFEGYEPEKSIYYNPESGIRFND